MNQIIEIGDIYWVIKEDQKISHPYVVISISENQELYIGCQISTNMKKAYLPGNIILEKGEASLIKKSIVCVSKMVEIKGTEISDYIGKLELLRIDEIKSGIKQINRMVIR